MFTHVLLSPRLLQTSYVGILSRCPAPEVHSGVCWSLEGLTVHQNDDGKLERTLVRRHCEFWCWVLKLASDQPLFTVSDQSFGSTFLMFSLLRDMRSIEGPWLLVYEYICSLSCLPLMLDCNWQWQIIIGLLWPPVSSFRTWDNENT